jgi:hypothetical protein
MPLGRDADPIPSISSTFKSSTNLSGVIVCVEPGCGMLNLAINPPERFQGYLPIYISRLSWPASVYAARISEYVNPPATNVITRCRTGSRSAAIANCPDAVPPGRGALCHDGFADRNDVGGPFDCGDARKDGLRRLTELLAESPCGLGPSLT